MTRRERWGFTWFVIVACAVTGTINWAVAQPQPRVSPRLNFQLIEFPNGSSWYIHENSIQAMWAVPRGDQERLGYKSKIYGAGYSITSPMELNEMLRVMLKAEKGEIEHLIKGLEDEKAKSE